MRLDHLIPLLLFFILLLIQTTVVPLIEINGVIPDLILILLVFYTIRHGQIYGIVLGFIFGFLFDIIAGSVVGSTMISKTLAGFTAGYFSNESKRHIYLNSFIFSLIVFLCAVID
jgi:rod shape-determining protein MreD